MVKRSIISGAPGTGKSTLIEGLQARGIYCAEEVSRGIIKKEQALESDGMPWGNMQRFSELVFRETIKRFGTAKDDQFCDRSLVDIIAYLTHANMEVFEDLKRFDFHQYYHCKVFFALPWEAIYCKDPQRPQDFQSHLLLSECLERVYKELGFTLCYLPNVSLEERISFVLEESSF